MRADRRVYSAIAHHVPRRGGRAIAWQSHNSNGAAAPGRGQGLVAAYPAGLQSSPALWHREEITRRYEIMTNAGTVGKTTSTAVKPNNIKRGVSLYSFQEEYFLRKMT